MGGLLLAREEHAKAVRERTQLNDDVFITSSPEQARAWIFQQSEPAVAVVDYELLSRHREQIDCEAIPLLREAFDKGIGTVIAAESMHMDANTNKRVAVYGQPLPLSPNPVALGKYECVSALMKVDKGLEYVRGAYVSTIDQLLRRVQDLAPMPKSELPRDVHNLFVGTPGPRGSKKSTLQEIVHPTLQYMGFIAPHFLRTREPRLEDLDNPFMLGKTGLSEAQIRQECQDLDFELVEVTLPERPEKREFMGVPYPDFRPKLYTVGIEFEKSFAHWARFTKSMLYFMNGTKEDIVNDRKRRQTTGKVLCDQEVHQIDDEYNRTAEREIQGTIAMKERMEKLTHVTSDGRILRTFAPGAIKYFHASLADHSGRLTDAEGNPLHPYLPIIENNTQVMDQTNLTLYGARDFIRWIATSYNEEKATQKRASAMVTLLAEHYTSLIEFKKHVAPS